MSDISLNENLSPLPDRNLSLTSSLSGLVFLTFLVSLYASRKDEHTVVMELFLFFLDNMFDMVIW